MKFSKNVYNTFHSSILGYEKHLGALGKKSKFI